MAVNTLRELGGRLAKLTDENLERVKSLLPPFWRESTPIDLLRDADVARYAGALDICLEDQGVDGVLVIFTPQGAARADELAKAVAAIAEKAWKPVITTWMGGKEAREGREILFQNNVPSYETPEEAVRTYLYMYNYERNLEIVHETPADVPIDSAPPKNTLKALARKVLAEGRTVLTEEESKRFLVNYRIPTTRTQVAVTVNQAVAIAPDRGLPDRAQDCFS